MEVSIKITFFWCMMSCNLIDRYHCFHWTSCLHSEHRKLNQWNQQVLVKFWYQSIPMMSVTTTFVHLFSPAASLCHSQTWSLLKAAFPMTELLQYISIYGVQFPIIEFDPETFRILLDYLHTGSCPLTCCNIPGLICAAEHYDLPELLQACFHHAKQFLRIEVVSIY